MTKNVQHTPGPWRIVEQTRIEADDYGLLASLRGEVSPHYETVTDANARLIAAAPDYREACKGLPQITDGESTTDYDKRVLAWFYLNAGKIYAANKKAAGQAA